MKSEYDILDEKDIFEDQYGKGKISNEYAERAVIGAMILRPEKISEIVEILRVEDFYYRKYMILYEKIKKISEENIGKIEPQFIIVSLEEDNLLKEIGGENTIINIVNEITTTANVMKYAEIIRENSKKRELIDRATEIIEIVGNENSSLENIIDEAHRMILGVNMENKSNDIITLKDMASQKIQKLSDISRDKGKDLRGLDTGFMRYNEITGGLHGSDLIILAARPAMGKTAFALNLAMNVAESGKHVLLFSLEMGNEQLFDRLLAIKSGIKLSKIRDGVIDGENDISKLANGLGKLSELSLYISDTSSLDIFEIKRLARKLHDKKQLDFIVIDYLQLISPSSNSRKNREQEISEISRALKLLAKELNIPIVTLSQLSRGVESRVDKRPLLSDLRESGAIEQDADMVLFLYRDKYYNKHNDMENEEERFNKNKGDTRPEGVELIIGKHRNGSIGTIILGFKPEYQQFINLITSEEEKRYLSPN